MYAARSRRRWTLISTRRQCVGVPVTCVTRNRREAIQIEARVSPGAPTTSASAAEERPEHDLEAAVPAYVIESAPDVARR
jgi:hypothetical protein